MKALSENINYMNNTFECFFYYQKHSPKVNLRRFHWSGPRDADLLAVMIVLSHLASIFFTIHTIAFSCLLCFLLVSSHAQSAYHYYLRPVSDDDIWAWLLLWSFLVTARKYKTLWSQSIIEKTTMSSQTTAVITVVDFSHITHIMDGALCVPYILVILWIFNQEYGFSMVWIELIKRFFSILKVWENLSHLGNVHRSLDGMG